MEKDVSCIEKDVPYLVYQGTMARFERIIKRLIIAYVITVVLFMGYLTYDKYTDSLYDCSTVDVNSEDGGNAAYMGDYANGVINNGKSSSEEENSKK